MKIYPCYQKAEHFTICDVSRQELVNLLDGIQKSLVSDSPWGKATARMFQQALDACKAYQMQMWDGNDLKPSEPKE